MVESQIDPVVPSRPARGAWIEMGIFRRTITPPVSRPARGAWIEILIVPAANDGEPTSRPARGAWIEMRNCSAKPILVVGRAPQGARGLK